MTGEPAFRHCFGMDTLEHRAQHPELNDHFNIGLALGAAGIAPAILAAYDFSAFRTVADVGGGQGALLAALLQAHPHLNATLLERPAVAAAARAQFQAAGVSARCRVVEGDFFDHVPGGADVLLLKSVLHDWDDERAATLLRNCRRRSPLKAGCSSSNACCPSTQTMTRRPSSWTCRCSRSPAAGSAARPTTAPCWARRVSPWPESSAPLQASASSKPRELSRPAAKLGGVLAQGNAAEVKSALKACIRRTEMDSFNGKARIGSGSCRSGPYPSHAMTTPTGASQLPLCCDSSKQRWTWPARTAIWGSWSIAVIPGTVSVSAPPLAKSPHDRRESCVSVISFCSARKRWTRPG